MAAQCRVLRHPFAYYQASPCDPTGNLVPTWSFSFTRPRTKRDWRSFGAFSAFLVALFTEMYGFPFTIYLLSGWLGSRFPGLDLHSHDAGWEGDPHFNPLHLLSNLLIAGGFILISSAWSVLYRAQSHGELARTGPYAAIRHP